MDLINDSDPITIRYDCLKLVVLIIIICFSGSSFAYAFQLYGVSFDILTDPTYLTLKLTQYTNVKGKLYFRKMSKDFNSSDNP